MKALIIGAGIGGLVTALQMHKNGIEVEVFDSAAELKPLGVGINLQPHATRELDSIGLLDSLTKASVVTSSLQYHSPDGALILKEARGLNAGYQYPQLSIHRGKLHMVLLDAFYAQIGSKNLHLAHQFSSFQQDQNSVIANFTNPKTSIKSQYTGSLLIGADGIHSTVRASLHPNQSPMQFSGIMMWRGTTYQKPFFDGSTVLVCGNTRVQLVAYPISHPDHNGNVQTNWVVEIEDPALAKLHEENWNRTGQLNDFIHYFDDWDLDFLNFSTMFKNAETVLEYPMVDRDPLLFWGNGLVTLLGDAAHPMYPRGGNGASQAIVDASRLVSLLQNTQNITLSLQKYEAERIPATTIVVNNNRTANQVAIFKLIEKHCNGKCNKVHTCIDNNIIQSIAETYKKQAGFSVEQVNTNK